MVSKVLSCLVAALPAALVAALVVTTPAAASTSHLCLSSGSTCVGTNGTAAGDKAVERAKPGRALSFIQDGGCYTFHGNCYATGILKFTAISGPDNCAVANSGTARDVQLGGCSATGSVWAQVVIGSHGDFEYMNRSETSHWRLPLVLSARNHTGDNERYECAAWWCTTGDGGWFQRVYWKVT